MSIRDHVAMVLDYCLPSLPRVTLPPPTPFPGARYAPMSDAEIWRMVRSDAPNVDLSGMVPFLVRQCANALPEAQRSRAYESVAVREAVEAVLAARIADMIADVQRQSFAQLRAMYPRPE